MQCVACLNWKPRETKPEMARLGFAVCAVKAKHQMFGAHYERQCQSYQAADEATVKAREAWLRERQ